MKCANCGETATQKFNNIQLCQSCFVGLKSVLITSSDEVYREALRQNEFEIRIWKEAFGQGFSLGFEAGRDVDMEKN